MLRRSILIVALLSLPLDGQANAAPAPAEEPVPGGDVQPSTVPLPPAISAALGRPTAPTNQGTEGPLDGRRDPGFTDTRAERQADQTYGSTNPTAVDASGNVLGDVTMTEAGLDTGRASGEVPEYHVVQSGDTLWDISSYYLADPYLWPKLWSWNDHVTNAHWIFPGDRIRLFDPYTTRTKDDGPSLRFSKTRIPLGGRRGPYLLTQLAYVDAERFDSAMTVVGGAEAKEMMATLDTIYLDYDAGNPPIPGERLVVYSPQEKVFDADGKRLLGYIVMIAGDVEIESVAREATEGTVFNAVNPIERGFKAGPLARRFRRVDPVPAEASVVGQVVATLNDTAPIDTKDKRRRRGSRRKRVRRGFGTDPLAGEEQFVVVDLGKGSGIKVGNILEVVRKGDQYTKKRIFNIPYEDGWPRRVTAALLVVQVDDTTSLGVSIYSRHEIERGDHVELRGPGVDNADTGSQQTPGVDADADASVEKDDGEVKASGGFRLGN